MPNMKDNSKNWTRKFAVKEKMIFGYWKNSNLNIATTLAIIMSAYLQNARKILQIVKYWIGPAYKIDNKLHDSTSAAMHFVRHLNSHLNRAHHRQLMRVWLSVMQ
jgi:hypothetical protein